MPGKCTNIHLQRIPLPFQCQNTFYLKFNIREISYFVTFNTGKCNDLTFISIYIFLIIIGYFNVNELLTFLGNAECGKYV